MRYNVDRIIRMLRDKYGLDMQRLKRGAIRSKIERIGELDSSRLLDEVLVGESYFFRDQGQFDAFFKEVLPILERSKKDKRLSIWSAGCSTGEEPYSIAMTIDRYGLYQKGWKVSILGTDLSRKAIKRAREGIYTEWSFRNTPGGIIDRYFVQLGENGYRIRDEIKGRVSFGVMNLMDTFAYPTGLDIIFCRNVLIYLDRDVIGGIINGFHRSLREGGWLFVGPGEFNGVWFRRFKPVFFENALVYRKPFSSRGGKVIRLPKRAETTDPSSVELKDAVIALRGNDLARAEMLLRRYIRQNQMDPYAYYLLGLIFQEKGFNCDAVEMFRRALYLDMDFAAAHFHIANLYRCRGEVKKAMKHLSLAERLLRMRDEDEPVPGEGELRCGELLAAVRMQRKLLSSCGGIKCEKTPN
ncbi:hypothetical protein J7M22_05020 [Candidatus Poribacteria bacterium]|nr:hypothetical protein [Candidatus Poribacteria bacterium]